MSTTRPERTVNTASGRWHGTTDPGSEGRLRSVIQILIAAPHQHDTRSAASSLRPSLTYPSPERRVRGLDISPVFASFTRQYFYGQ